MKRYKVKNFFYTFVEIEIEAENEKEAKEKYLKGLATGDKNFGQEFTKQALYNLTGDEFMPTEVTEIK